MRRDLDLVREMLERLEAADGALDTGELVGEIDRVDGRGIAYHATLLREAGFAVEYDSGWWMTWQGHEYLDGLRAAKGARP